MSQGLLTVMAGYFAGCSIPRTTQLLVEALSRHSRHLLLVFDNPAPAELPQRWQGLDLTVVFERHGGYDFGSYRRGLEQAQARGLLEQASHVLLCNDSVLGPLGDLGPLLQRMQAAPDQAWGLTASHQLTPHLQSYFVLLGRELLERPPLQRFFKGIEPLPSRYAVIQRYELGLSRAVLAAGAALQAWVQPHMLREPRTGKPACNPTTFPLSLVKLGVPLIKARALRELSANQQGIAATCQLIAERNLKLWQALWAQTPHRRFWLQQLRIGVLLPGADAEQLPERLAWLEEQEHRGVQLLLPIQAEALEHQATLERHHAHSIAQGRLSLLRIPEAVPPGVGLQQSLSAAEINAICMASPALWQNRLSLSLQALQMAAQPSLPKISGDPELWQCAWLLRQPAGSLHMLTSKIF